MERHNNFDLMRLLAALSVIFSHAFLLAENSQDHDPLMILTGGQTILGLVGVFTFFTISGYLITQSFEQTPSPLVFLAKRALRIFPGLVACLVVCVFVIGPAVTSLPLKEYFTRPEPYLFLAHNAVLDVDYNRLPGVVFWQNNIGGIVDGPLWSLPSEALLYVMLCVLGLCRLLSVPVCLVLVAIGVVCLKVDTSGELIGSTGWLMGFFATGMCCYRLRGTRFFDPRWRWVALAGLVASVPLRVFVPAFPLFGSYLLISLAVDRRIPSVKAARFGDLSYGLYIYGWPIEQCVVYASGDTAKWWQVFLIATAISTLAAFLSWHLVEKRCRWRRAPAPTAALAPVRV
ncbi:MAG TPA: acyltransferase [Stellaceae bacterium]|jgi:peptidoglycan/LPS O-acetylase OafA/YrhL|nr:acyltransferase [Stellaceae bacterium]